RGCSDLCRVIFFEWAFNNVDINIMVNDKEFNALMELYLSAYEEAKRLRDKCEYLEKIVNNLRCENNNLAERWIDETNANLKHQLKNFKNNTELKKHIISLMTVMPDEK